MKKVICVSRSVIKTGSRMNTGSILSKDFLGFTTDFYTSSNWKKAQTKQGKVEV